MNDNSYRVIEVDINEILPNRFQPRIQFDEEEILELSGSIKEHGVIQPIVVRTIGDKYEIIAGERRYKASVLAGKETVPVIIKNLNDKDSAEIALIENIQRKNLTPIEEALSYKKILDMGYLTQESLALKLGKSQSSVANKIRLLNLSEEVQEALLDNKISERHARSLLRLKSQRDQDLMLDTIISQRLTVRKTDEEIDKMLNGDLTEEIVIKEEKGEMEMNNEVNQIPNVITQQGNTFDIFGGTPITPEVPSVPVMPTVEPVAPVAPTMGGIQFDGNGVVVSAPEVPSVPVMPTVEPVVPVAPTMGGIQFDGNGVVVSAPEVPSVPVTAPIMESPVISPQPVVSEPIVETPVAEQVIETPVIPEVIAPTPIIVTDYSKQYDPIMPNTQVSVEAKPEFKEVIAALRECSNKIEQYGYKIDVEEYDLSTIYQVVFKIEK